ncbi:MAG: glycosyltransferase family 39 protein [Chryseolinea sp.]
MIARNFYEHGPDILHPTVDVGGEKSGITGSEFPVLNYLIYLVAKVFGYQHWYGRLIVLAFSSLGVYFFYKSIRMYFGESAAFNGTMLLLVSFWFSYSRKIIPDAFAISLCMIGLYQALMYWETGKWWRLILFIVLCVIGCMSKISAAAVLTVLALPLFKRSIPLSRKAFVAIGSLFILGGACWWYFLWVPHLNESYGFGDHFFMGLPFKEGFDRIIQNPGPVLKRFYSTPMKYTGFALFVFALFMVIRKRNWYPLAVFLLPFTTFLIILVKTGTSIIGDTYYILTMIPAMAFIAGYGLTYIQNKRIAIFILVVVAVESLAAQIYDFRIREPYKSLERLEAVMDEVSNRDDKILVTAPTHEPTAMYFTHRRGWVALPQSIFQDTAYISHVKSNGCKYIVVTRKLYGELDMSLPVVHDSEHFKIYKLD